ncbi:MAG TPA: hypothetical protein VK968_16180 [Roseimicrobium sp.]|nr:hypothetical protein [Roseimicrobium sp.]
MLGLLLKASMVARIPVEVLAAVLYSAILLATMLLLFHLTRRWTGSRIFATIACCLILLEPAYYANGVGQNFFFYEFPLQLVLLALVGAAWTHDRTPSWKSALAVVLLIATASNLRSIFHPIVFGLVCLVWQLLIPRRIPWRQTVALLTLGAALLLGWPVKNWLLFGAFTASSVDGFNMARELANLPKPFSKYMNEGTVPPDIDVRKQFPALRNFSDESLLPITRTAKPTGERTWNHYMMLVSRSETMARGLKARDVSSVPPHMKQMYWYTMRPMYVEPYELTSFGPEFRPLSGYLRVYDAVFYQNFGTPKRSRTLYGMVWFPLLVTGIIFRLALVSDNRRTFALLACLMLFPLAVIIATDGVEGNRMRFNVYPLTVLIACILTHDFIQAIQRRWLAYSSPRA